jgi:hypothetical protein
LKQLKSLLTFPDKSGQVVLADFEQQFIPALAISYMLCAIKSEIPTTIKLIDYEKFKPLFDFRTHINDLFL